MTCVRILALLFGVAALLAAQSGTFSAITNYSVSDGGAFPVGITRGPDGALWFAEYSTGGGGGVGRITTTGAITLFSDPSGYGAQGITEGPDGNLWFTEDIPNLIGRITPGGVITEFPIPVGLRPEGITAGPDGALWFTVTDGGGFIGRITTEGVITEYPLPTSNAQPFGITTGPDAAIWFAEDEASQIGRISSSGQITEYAAGGNPASITSGPDGALWYTEALGGIGRITTSGEVTQYSAPGSASFQAITTGPDKALWYVQYDGELSRITTDGIVTNFPAPNSPESITVGPDGNLWFTEAGAAVGHAPACALGLSASFANDTLTMDFDLSTARPAIFDIILYTSGGYSDPYTKSIPAVVPPHAFTLTHASVLNTGKLTVIPRLLSQSTNQVMCAEYTTVNTN